MATLRDGHDDDVDPLADAVARLAAARQAVADARVRADRLVADARDRERSARDDVHAAILWAYRAGRRQSDIARTVGLSREQVRRICRAAGLD